MPKHAKPGESYDPDVHEDSPQTEPVPDEAPAAEPKKDEARNRYGGPADRAARLDGTSLHAIEVEQSRRGDEFLKACTDEELAAAVARRRGVRTNF